MDDGGLCAVPDCYRRVRDATVCTPCIAELRRALGRVPELAAELDTAVTRGDRMGGGSGGRRSAEAPLVFNAGASEVGWVLRNALVTWVRVLANAYGEDQPPRRPPRYGPVCRRCAHASCAEIRRGGAGLPEDNLPAMAGWLSARAERVRLHEAGGECVDEVLAALAEVLPVLDLPVERAYVGPCASCGADLYTRPGAPTATCRDCGHAHDADARLGLLHRWADAHLGTAAEVAGAVSRMGRPVTAELLRKWVQRGKLAQYPPDPRDDRRRPRYRVGDVIGLLPETERA
ncbi:hypothetical protein [Allonocardiopsis opalescens]|uniref:Uncharacterized protein n=1 Tax=Allonocardiopsis opalescens TaxID=1144618 RepID=A0A2T0PPM7_9ACTN|nr:hypothetical protein [Allonocardiopsis opalescens]PRX90844.1 hypothetical protein CLV72_11640 [Allonocardiopsis opalescens]